MDKINRDKLAELLQELDIPTSEFTVLSSCALIFRGLYTEANDLDIAVTEKGLAELRKKYNLKQKDNGWYQVNDKVECVLDPMIGKREFNGLYYIQDIDDYYNYLKQSNREKDKARIDLIKPYLNRREYVKKYATLETPRLILRKAKETDLEDMYNNIWTDPSLAHNMLWPLCPNIQLAKERLARNIFLHKYNFSYFVVLKETNHVIGWAGTHEIEPHIFEDFGICVASKYQGMGIGKEILSSLEDLAFNELGAEKFIYSCFSTNKKSSGLCTSLGFTYLSSEPQVRKHDGYNYILDRYSLDYETYKSFNKSRL